MILKERNNVLITW